VIRRLQGKADIRQMGRRSFALRSQKMQAWVSGARRLV